MPAPVLTKNQLNRTYLARQMLIEREDLPVREAVARLVGLQSQVNNPPYIGLWTRLTNFRISRCSTRKWLFRSDLCQNMTI